jgi:hypothetical protein
MSFNRYNTCSFGQPNAFEDKMFLIIEDYKFGEGPKYFLTLKKKSNNFS